MTRHLVVEIPIALLALEQRFAQPRRWCAPEHGLQAPQDVGDVLRLPNLDRVNVLCNHARRGRTTDRCDVQNRTVVDGVELRRQLILVAVLLQIAVELEGLEKSMTLGGNLVDRKILGPSEMRIHALQILGGESDFHTSCSWLCVNEPQPAFPPHGLPPANASSPVWRRGDCRETCCRFRTETRACRDIRP